MRIYNFLLLAFCFSPFLASGQVAISNFPSKVHLAEPVKTYQVATQFSQNLYNGRVYFLYDHKSEEHQFYNEREWYYGSVRYDGQRFDSVQLKYDIHRQELLIHHLNGDHMILQSAKVSDFIIYNHHFKRLISGKDIADGMKTGYYDIVYNGKTQAIIFRRKDRQEKIDDKRVIALFPQKDMYYVYRSGAYKQVRTKKSVLALFPGHERTLKKSLRAKQINFRKNREEAILTMVQKYDQTVL